MSSFGPLALLGLFTAWVLMLINGFALMHWGRDSLGHEIGMSYVMCLYHSGETFFTLGYGDVTPVTELGRLLAVVEAGTGFGFMAVIIGYLPVLYQAFSRREQIISLLDARAGSPPAVSELLQRLQPFTRSEAIPLLAEWEGWSAELLESHLSFPVLSYYRSQHDNQSWLAALAVMLDTSAVLLVGGSALCQRRARLTFAMARHACVDLCLIFWLPPVQPPQERLTSFESDSLFKEESAPIRLSVEQVAALGQLRAAYEPFLQALADYFCFRLPRFYPEHIAPDNWQTTAWTKPVPRSVELSTFNADTKEHFT